MRKVLYWPLLIIVALLYLSACAIGALIDGVIIGSRVVRGKPIDYHWH